MSDQDWNDVVWRKNKSSKNSIHNDKDAPAPITVKKYQQKNNNKPTTNMKKLEEDTENLAVERVSNDIKVEIQKARTAKKLTQKQLATMINERQDVIQSYENGKAIPNQQVLNKLRRALGIRLKKK